MPQPHSADYPVRISRRTALAGGALGIGLVTGCTSTSRGLGKGTSTDPDEAITRSASAAITRTQRLLQRTATKHPGLSEPLDRLQELHTAHLKLLESGATDPTASPSAQPPVAGTSRAAIKAVVTAETTCSTDLATLAGKAQSGTLARALASMSASLNAGLTALPDTPGGAA